MLKIGSVVLSLWCVLNIFASLIVILIPTIFMGKNAPALTISLSEVEINSLSSILLANGNGIAVYANGINVAFCLLLLVVIWKGLYQKVEWAFAALSIALVTAFLTGVAADYVAGFPDPKLNIISGGILFAGLAFSSLAILRSE